MIDSAKELLSVIIEQDGVAMPQPHSRTESASAPVVKQRRAAATKASPAPTASPAHATPAASPAPNTSRMSGTAVLRQFMESHTGEFKIPDVLSWAKKHGLSVDNKLVKSACYSLANIGKEVINKGRGTGVYQKAA